MIDEQIRLDITRALAGYYTEVDKVEAEVAKLGQIVKRLTHLREFCEVLVVGSDPEGVDVLAETYPEIWYQFIRELEAEDVLCDHDDFRFRKALAGLIGEWVSDLED